MRWSGSPLDDPLRDLLEAFLAVDLGAVRIHRGRGARLLTRCFGAAGVAFGRRLFFSPEGARCLDGRGVSAAALAAHEVAHVLQYRRYGFFGMLARYGWEYLRRRLAWRSHDAAYRGIGFEREAREVAERVGELLRCDPEALGAVRDGLRLPAPSRQRAAEEGSRVRCGLSPGPPPRGR